MLLMIKNWLHHCKPTILSAYSSHVPSLPDIHKESGIKIHCLNTALQCDMQEKIPEKASLTVEPLSVR